MSFGAVPENPIAHQRYRELPPTLFAESNPSPVRAPSLVELNRPFIEQIGTKSDWFCSGDALSILSGNAVHESNPPIAMAYSGHQFGHWVPSLGDGRAHMLGQMAAADGALIDVQLKGSGRTGFTRRGDGRASLGSVLREYMVSEAMAGLEIPTTRSLAVIGTGEDIDREQALPGAILVRTAGSHVRVGSFQYASAHLGEEGVRVLADFVIANHFPELRKAPSRYLELLGAVVERQATLIARWMLVGFIHGVMNTDNMSIIGETIDYGPCAFIDEFHPKKVFSSIDRYGRYAWDQQPSIAHWNLTRLAETLLPLVHEAPASAEALAEEALAKFGPLFQRAFQRGMQAKLGVGPGADGTMEFAQATFAAMAKDEIDFTVFFDRLTQVAAGKPDAVLLELFSAEEAGSAWLLRWRALRTECAESAASMRRANPVVIARNHRVEEAIDAAVDSQDFEPFRRICRIVANPFESDPADREFETPPQPEERVTQTFCGT